MDWWSMGEFDSSTYTLGAKFYYFRSQEQRNIVARGKKIGIGITLGISAGAVIGSITGNMAISISFGVVVGIVVGVLLSYIGRDG